MTTSKITAAADIIREGALQFLADKESITVSQVCKMIIDGHEGAVRQFNQLVIKGIEEAMNLHKAGRISLS